MNRIERIITDLGGANAPILSVLLAVQDISDRQYIDEKSVNEIARLLGVSRSRIYSTASFYNEISLKPRGKHLIRVCGNAPCENAGKELITRTLERELGIKTGETTKDGLFTLEAVSCLGACYMSPAIKVGDLIYGDLTPERAIEIVSDLRKGQEDETA
ncbi:NAD(P)H-dependent oxidoreductase subunit E [Christensenellaceae bacterium OttesenSCG-928-K19]|nr:NAD(P)H-dependent oxidoreductase subunit E [Christensenellaceae bacterium OttesenSCG-928-K19]